MADRFRVLLGAAFCAAALDAQALSIGPARGEAVVGQPLELGFELSLDAGAEVNSSCIGAELFYGDSRVDPSRVRVSSRAGTRPDQALVQVATAMAVNEPVVSVQVKAGCATPVSRRFVLLSSSPVAAPLVNAVPERPLAQAAEVSRPVGRQPAAEPRAPATSTAPARATASPPRRRSEDVPATARASAPAPQAAPAGSGGSGSRARLELQSPLEWLQEQALPLRASDRMADPALTTTAEQRATAAALWRTLNLPEAGAAPADSDEQQRVQALEAQVKNLQTAARMARGRENDLQLQLGEAQRERDTAWFILWPLAGLAALLALAGAAVWWRRRRGQDGAAAWWKPRRKAAFGADAATVFGEGFVDTQPAPVDFSYPAEDPQVPPPVRMPEATGAAAAAPAFEASALPSELPPLEPTSAEAAMRAARELRQGSANDLADVQQNADFFASLGQYDQAIELLQDHIASHPGTSPVAYLDLLKLFHTLSLTDPYRKLRADFTAVFNAEVPPFASFLKTSRDLASYADVLKRISDTWARPHVLDLIESLLVRHSGEGAHAPFPLEAYRDLLLLYEIAKIEHSADGGRLMAAPSALAAGVTGGAGMAAAAAVPAAVPEQPVEALDFPLEPEPAFSVPPVGSSLGVPLDFGRPNEAAPAPHPSLDDIDLPLPVTPVPPVRPDEAPSGDPHLIDFDMFDVAVPPASKPKP